MEHIYTGSVSFFASHCSVLVGGVLLPLAAGAVWALYRYHFRPSDVHRSVDVRTQQGLRRHVLFESTHGKPASVLQAFQEYARKDHVIKRLLLTGEQDHFLEDVAKRCNPKTVLVLGTQCGYTAIRLLQLLPSSAMLYAVEQEESVAESAEEMILVAGFKNNQFRLLCQHPVDAIRDLKSQFGVKMVDFVLMDYLCGRHVEGLLALTESGILRPGTVILSHRSDHPTCRDFRKYIEAAKEYRIVDSCQGLLKVEYVQ